MASGNASAGGGPSAGWPREGASHARAHNETDHNQQHSMSADCKCASEQDCCRPSWGVRDRLRRRVEAVRTRAAAGSAPVGSVRPEQHCTALGQMGTHAGGPPAEASQEQCTAEERLAELTHALEQGR
eukprot:11741766-Alexandrium_andersonii.AAC.1